jgi:DNA-nicking Smr family endonuclease
MQLSMTSKPPKNINSEESALFREAAAGARPVTTRRVSLRQAPPPPRAVFRRRDERQALQDSMTVGPEALDLETGEELAFRRPSVSATVFRQLRRGRYAIKAEIDLHGLTSDQARQELRTFLAESVEARIQCVRVVHGKGRRSGPRGPVLKARVDRWLRQWDDVLAFVSAPARDGGTGAVYVLLRR